MEKRMSIYDALGEALKALEKTVTLTDLDKENNDKAYDALSNLRTDLQHKPEIVLLPEGSSF